MKVMSFSGLLVDFAKHTDSNLVVRGLRAISDFDYELQMAQTNRKMNADVDTMFLATSLEYAYLSSTTVKEVAFCDGKYQRVRTGTCSGEGSGKSTSGATEGRKGVAGDE